MKTILLIMILFIFCFRLSSQSKYEKLDVSESYRCQTNESKFIVCDLKKDVNYLICILSKRNELTINFKIIDIKTLELIYDNKDFDYDVIKELRIDKDRKVLIDIKNLPKDDHDSGSNYIKFYMYKKI
jgi:hypothetical protein